MRNKSWLVGEKWSITVQSIIYVSETLIMCFHSQLASRTLEVTLWSENKTKRNVFLGEVQVTMYTTKFHFALLPF